MKKRIVWIDILRIVATWGVICIHDRELQGVRGTRAWYEWEIMGDIFTWAVPVFLMLSGLLSLKETVSVKETLTRRVPRVLGMIVLSLFLNGAICRIYQIVTHNLSWHAVKEAVFSWGYGHSYLYVLLGLYLCLPIVSYIVQHEELEKYFIGLSLFFNLVIPIFVDASIMPRIPIITSFMKWLSGAEVYLPVGAVLYFILGHYCGKKRLSKRVTLVMLMSSLVLWLTISLVENESVVLRYVNLLRVGKYYGGYVSTITMLLSVSVFMFFKSWFENVRIPAKIEKGINEVGRCTLLIFLMHGPLINALGKYMPVVIAGSQMLATVAVTSIYFTIALIIALGLVRVPGIRKLV